MSKTAANNITTTYQTLANCQVTLYKYRDRQLIHFQYAWKMNSIGNLNHTKPIGGHIRSLFYLLLYACSENKDEKFKRKKSYSNLGEQRQTFQKKT